MSFTFDFQNESKRQDRRGRCLHFADGTLCNQIVSAHSIQKSGQLSLIAEEGHVYRLSADLATLRKTGGIPDVRKVGVGKVSTFLGFCKQHDNALFEPIDNEPLGPVRKQAALYAYRSLCRELFVKDNAVELMVRMKDHADTDSQTRLHLASSLTGHTLGLNGLIHHKILFDEALRSEAFDEFDFIYFNSKSRCSLQVSGLLYPDFDFLARELQSLGNGSTSLDLITFFTAPTENGWAFGFAWHKSSGRTCIPFIEALGNRIAHGEKAQDALLRFAFSTCENHAFRISWWDQLPDNAKREVIERVASTLHPQKPIPKNYLAVGLEGIADWEYEHVYTTLHTAA